MSGVLNLVQEFRFGGNHSLEAFIPGTLEYDLTSGHVRREQELITLGKASVAAQLETTRSIERSSAELANEIRWQTFALSEVLQSGFKDITGAIYGLQDRLHIELSEIRWLLFEQNTILRQILEVLKKRRKTEAQELVEQGRRNYENKYFQESIERFKLALKYDNTDYEAYMSLGFAYIHVDDANTAAKSFEKAVAFAHEGNPLFKAEALINLARSYYCLDEWQQAGSCCVRIINADGSLPQSFVARVHYDHGVYSVKVGDTQAGLRSLKEAIRIADSYVSVALCDEDWGNAKDEVHKLLNELSRNRISEARAFLKQTLEKFESIKSLTFNQGRTLGGTLKRAAEILQRPCYSGACEVIRNCALVQEGIDPIREIARLDPEATELKTELESASASLNQLRRERDDIIGDRQRLKDDKAGPIRVVSVLGSYIVWYAVTFGIGSFADFDEPDGGDILIVLFLILSTIAGFVAPIPLGFFVAERVLGRISTAAPAHIGQKIAEMERFVTDGTKQFQILDHRLNELNSMVHSTISRIGWSASAVRS